MTPKLLIFLRPELKNFQIFQISLKITLYNPHVFTGLWNIISLYMTHPDLLKNPATGRHWLSRPMQIEAWIIFFFKCPCCCFCCCCSHVTLHQSLTPTARATGLPLLTSPLSIVGWLKIQNSMEKNLGKKQTPFFENFVITGQIWK